MESQRPTDLNFRDGNRAVENFSGFSAIAADAYRNDMDFSSLLRTSSAVPLEFGDAPILIGFDDGNREHHHRSFDKQSNDDMDTVTQKPGESPYRMQAENEQVMNEPLPEEYPVLTPEQKTVKDNL